MVRGIFTEHVMHAVSQEMFGGAQGRAYLAKVLPQLEASSMDPRQKEVLRPFLCRHGHSVLAVCHGEPRC